MNIKRIVFWACFLIILTLIVWGLAIAMNKQVNVDGTVAGSPPPITTTDHVKGPADSPVTIIEYSDFQCPACETYYWIVARLLAAGATVNGATVNSATTSIRFVYRHFPLPQHANAIPSAMASEAAGDQGKFWEMYDLIFANATDWVDQADPTATFIGYAGKIGLNIAKFTADLKDAAIRQKVDADLQSGRDLGINATPTFFINGKVITNPQTYADFKKLIDEAASASIR